MLTDAERAQLRNLVPGTFIDANTLPPGIQHIIDSVRNFMSRTGYDVYAKVVQHEVPDENDGVLRNVVATAVIGGLSAGYLETLRAMADGDDQWRVLFEEQVSAMRQTMARNGTEGEA